MDKRIIITETEEATPTGRTALMAEAYVTPATPARRRATPPLEWQALLLRYLPEPVSVSHSVKRFAVR